MGTFASVSSEKWNTNWKVIIIIIIQKKSNIIVDHLHLNSFPFTKKKIPSDSLKEEK